jgi:hypothetical protein
MKAKARSLFLMILLGVCLACSKDKDPSPSSGDIGTYVGSIQVVNDPQTDLGYILNARVTVTINGSSATVKIKGDPGFDREFTGAVVTQIQDLYRIDLTKQTKPVEKIAGNRVQISGNELTMDLNIANDKVTVRDSPSNTATFDIAGKISMVGTRMLKE